MQLRRPIRMGNCSMLFQLTLAIEVRKLINMIYKYIICCFSITTWEHFLFPDYVVLFCAQAQELDHMPRI